LISSTLAVSTTRNLHYIVWAQVIALAIGLAVGCTTKDSKNDQEIRQQAAQTTAEVKQGAKQAGEQIKEGATVAERKIDDVAAGVKDGLKAPSPAGTADATGAVDINSATETRLTTLPGVGPAEARKIIRNRPYDRAHELVTKGVMDEDEFAKVSARVVVR
jgi:DNA uptake protein ComE-like DNA-binding protein